MEGQYMGGQQDCALLIIIVMAMQTQVMSNHGKQAWIWVGTQMEQGQSITRVIKGTGPYSQGLVIAAGHHLPPLLVKGNAPYSRSVP